MHLRTTFIKKAPLSGAFFVCISLLWLPPSSHAASQACAPGTATTTVSITHVHDGDTVILADGRRVRLLGIDTPELARDNIPAQPYATEARDYLRKLLPPSSGVRLQFDQEQYDRHGRSLAHVFLPDGTNIQQQLLAAGLATALVIPPNLAHLECYRTAEEEARAAGTRIWSLAGYAPAEAGRLDPGARGFHIIRGEITRVGLSRKSIWLNLGAHIALRIDRKDLQYFDPDIHWQQKETLVKRQVLARGWLHYNSRRNELFMRIRHPAALTIYPRETEHSRQETRK